jgi:hypothetical protein
MRPGKTPPSKDGLRKRSDDGRYFLRLWAVVTVFWTAATLFRVNRVWVPIDGWQNVLAGPWLWLELGLPPLMFGVVTAAVCQLVRNQRNSGVSWPRCRRRHDSASTRTTGG